MQLKACANNVDAAETACNELSLLKSALFATKTLNIIKFDVGRKWTGPIFYTEEPYLWNSTVRVTTGVREWVLSIGKWNMWDITFKNVGHMFLLLESFQH